MAESEGWEKTFQITGISPGQVGLSAAQPEDIPRPPAVTAGEVNRKLSSARYSLSRIRDEIEHVEFTAFEKQRLADTLTELHQLLAALEETNQPMTTPTQQLHAKLTLLAKLDRYPNCVDDSHLFLSEYEKERAQAVLMCTGCLVLAECGEAADAYLPRSAAVGHHN